jgi:mono/diheme cytochrome c family protein
MNRFGYLSISGLGLATTLLAIAVQAQEAPRTAGEGPPATPPAAQQPAPSVDPNVSRLFATSCGWCHQAGGRVAGRGPKLAGTDKSDEFIIRQIKQGKPPGMPAFGKSFNDDQIQAIVAYIRALPETP